MMYREIKDGCSEIQTKDINTLRGQKVDLLNVKLGGTYSNHWAVKGYVSVIKTSQLMLYREIKDGCSDIHTKDINTLCGQNLELLNVKIGGTYSNHWAVKG